MAYAQSACNSLKTPFEMVRLLTLLLPALLALPPSVGTSATLEESAANAPRSQFYSKNAEGWYWYQDPEEEVVQEVKEPLPPPPPAEQPVQTAQQAKPTPPPALSAAWVREMLPKYRDVMWTDPTPENVQAYFILQKFAVARSAKVADVAKQVTLGNALLDESMKRPISNFASIQVGYELDARKDAVLKDIASKAGIFFFFKSNCRFCEKQAPILKLLEKDGFDILAVSIDGGQLQSAQFDHTRVDSGQAFALGIDATPATFLVTPDGQFETISLGLSSYPEMRERIFIAAGRKNLITEEQIEATKPVFDPKVSKDSMDTMLPQLLKASADPISGIAGPADLENLQTASAAMPKIADETGFIPPAKLLALFGDSAKTSGQMNID